MAHYERSPAGGMPIWGAYRDGRLVATVRAPNSHEARLVLRRRGIAARAVRVHGSVARMSETTPDPETRPDPNAPDPNAPDEGNEGNEGNEENAPGENAPGESGR